jgi:hypothetical protein
METFVVRIWAPADARERDTDPSSVKGRLEHVASGRGMAFRGTDDLARLIVRELRRTMSDAGLTGNKEG